MARQARTRDLAPIHPAAKLWIERCLVDDGSLFADGRALWTAEGAAILQTSFVERPITGDEDFMTKLQRQMADAGAPAQQLMAEMMWVLLLFPSNIGAEVKRGHVTRIWSWSGESLSPGHALLQDPVLAGVGSAGTAYNNLRWKELAYLIALTRSLKGMPREERQGVLADYRRFLDWIEGVPRDGQRQFRHMLRYFAFPDRVERMSSNRDRRAILEAFGIAPRAQLSHWQDRRLDEALLTLRQQLEAERPGQVFDFYDDAEIKAKWRPRQDEVAEAGNGDAGKPLLAEEPAAEFGRGSSGAERGGTPPVGDGPVNLIVYGPPGTGKTHWLRQKMAEYTDAPNEVDPATWLTESVATVGWRSVIAAALADLGRPTRVPDLRAHKWVQAKALQRGRAPAGIQATLWGYLQEHTPESSTTVNIGSRRPPFIFDKRESGDWHLLPGWEEVDDEAADLWQTLKAGPRQAMDAVHRYKVVTFHPSFTYEEFVRGIRPVATAEDGSTQFRLVDGKFKQICDEAHANPGKRYAIFIDEINRANIAKVFGELITLIEPDKRARFDERGRLVEGMAVHLPGGDDTDKAERPFGVPKNLDIYGTMNTADRSIALLDVALRRRFRFEERGPDYSQLRRAVEGVQLDRLLERVNDRLEYLLDRDHRIGHAYLMHAMSLDDVRLAFAKQIIPLLQEYFFDDFSRVAMVLATVGEPAFVDTLPLTADSLFTGQRPEGVAGERTRYMVAPASTWTAETFRGVYEPAAVVGDAP